MNKAIRAMAHRFGYRISRVSRYAEEDPFAALNRLLADVPEPIIFDVGAHRGSTSTMFRSIFPAAMIYAFEPFPESFERLKAELPRDPRTHLFNFGLSDRDGPCSFHANANSATNSLLATDASGARTWGAGLLDTARVIEAQFKMLDTVMRELGLPRIDILKMDVQGAEHLVISGGAGACQQRLIRLVYAEVITQPTYTGQRRLDEALRTYYDRGFDLYNIYNHNLTDEGRLRCIDAIFTRAAPA